MFRHTRPPAVIAATLLLAAGLLSAGCGGSGIEGTYSGRGTGFLQQLVFKSDGKVELTFMGMTKEGTYVVEDKKVKVVNGTDTAILTIADDGCLDGGGILGRYCKEGTATGTSGASTRGLSGNYEARHPEGSIALNFEDADKVRMTITENGRVNDSAVGSYEVDGGQVKVQFPGGPPLELTQKGNALEGWVQGVGMKFVKTN